MPSPSEKPVRSRRKRLRKRINIAIGQILIAIVIAFSRTLPLAARRSLAKRAGRFLFNTVRKRREQALRSIETAYGDSLSPEAKAAIALGSLQNLATVAMEFSFTPRLLRVAPDTHVRVVGVERCDRSKGCIVVSGHMSNWEWLAPAVAAHGIPVAEVVQSYEREPYARQLNTIRESAGVRTVPQDNAATEVRKLLAEGYIVGILIDRSPRDTGVPVKFFGKDCWATSGPAFIALRSKVPVYFAALHREPDGSYVLEFEEIKPANLTGGFREDVRIFTQAIQDAMERHIRAYPDQWFWMTNRWRRREHLEAKWGARVPSAAESNAN